MLWPKGGGGGGCKQRSLPETSVLAKFWPASLAVSTAGCYSSKGLGTVPQESVVKGHMRCFKHIELSIYLFERLVDGFSLGFALFLHPSQRLRLLTTLVVVMLATETDDVVVRDSVHVVAESEKADLAEGRRRNREG